MLLAGVIQVAILVVLFLGIPISVALGLGGALGLYLKFDFDVAWATVRSLPYALSADYNFAVLPLFILMGYLVTAAGVTTRLYEMAQRWLSQFRGGLIMATIVAAAFFGALSGSSVASAAIFTKIGLPEMLNVGYDRRFASGSIAAAGTLAATIPPSILLVLYGIITGESIGWLLIAGIIPGAVTAIVYVLTVFAVGKLRPQWCPRVEVKYTWGERLRGITAVLPVVALFLMVIGGLYGGFFTPTAAGAVGAFGAFAIALFTLRGRAAFSGIYNAMRESVEVTSTIFIIIIGGYMYGRFLALSGVVAAASQFVTSLAVPALVIMLGIIILYLILGMFMEGASIMVLTLPVLYPVVRAMGYDLVWFGILIALLIEIGLMTPPVGLNTYVVYGAAEGKVELHEVFVGTAPFLFANLVVIALLFLAPWLATWLPSMMG